MNLKFQPLFLLFLLQSLAMFLIFGQAITAEPGVFTKKSVSYICCKLYIAELLIIQQ